MAVIPCIGTSCPTCNAALYKYEAWPGSNLPYKYSVACTGCGKMFYSGNDENDADAEIAKYTVGTTQAPAPALPEIEVGLEVVFNKAFVDTHFLRMTAGSYLPEVFVVTALGTPFGADDIGLVLKHVYDPAAVTTQISYSIERSKFWDIFSPAEEKSIINSNLSAKEIYEKNKNSSVCVGCGKKTYTRPVFTGTIQYCDCVDKRK